MPACSDWGLGSRAPRLPVFSECTKLPSGGSVSSPPPSPHSSNLDRRNVQLSFYFAKQTHTDRSTTLIHCFHLHFGGKGLLWLYKWYGYIALWASEQKADFMGDWMDWVIPLTLLWLLEHMRCQKLSWKQLDPCFLCRCNASEKCNVYLWSVV